MAKKSTHNRKTYLSNVSGKSIQDIMNMAPEDIMKMSGKDLRDITGRLASAANKRLRNLEKSKAIAKVGDVKDISTAYRYIMDNGGDFSVKGKNLNQVRSEFKRAKRFLESKSSTAKGAIKLRKEQMQALKDAGFTNLTPENFNEAMKMYDNLKEFDPTFGLTAFKYKVMYEAAIIAEKDEFDLAEEVERLKKKLVEVEGAKKDGASNFYNTIEDNGEDLPFK